MPVYINTFFNDYRCYFIDQHNYIFVSRRGSGGAEAAEVALFTLPLCVLCVKLFAILFIHLLIFVSRRGSGGAEAAEVALLTLFLCIPCLKTIFS